MIKRQRGYIYQVGLRGALDIGLRHQSGFRDSQPHGDSFFQQQQQQQQQQQPSVLAEFYDSLSQYKMVCNEGEDREQWKTGDSAHGPKFPPNLPKELQICKNKIT